jgi:hypothetical protein
MSNCFSRSLRPLLIGSLVVLAAACRRDDDPSKTTDTTSAVPATARSSETAPMPSAMPDPRVGAADLNPDERMPVAGRDEAIELGAGGSTGAGGSGGHGGSAGSHHH